MSEPINDGAGTGNLAKVDTKHRLHIASVSRTEKDAAISDGRLFIMSSTLLTLTDDTETPMIYIKNLDDRLLFLDLFIISTGVSDGTGNTYVRSYTGLNDSSTIIVNESPALVGNANPASPLSFNGVVYKGVTGDTIVDGTQFVTFIIAAGDKISTPTDSALSKNGDACYSFQAPAGNTSMDVSVIVAGYYIDKELPE